MKKGFTPVEIMLGLAIGVMLGGVLMQALYQLAQSLRTVSAVSSVDTRMLVMQNIFEKEFAGLIAPALVSVEQEENLDGQKVQPQSPQPKEMPAQPAETSARQSLGKGGKRPVVVEKPFYCQQDGTTMKLLTFVTTNPLAVYKMAKPCLARVVYRLIPDQQQSEFFALHRQETPLITDPDKFLAQEHQVKGFVVAGGIKSLEFEFLTPEEKQSESEEEESQTAKSPTGQTSKEGPTVSGVAQRAKPETKKGATFKTVKQWDYKPPASDEKDEKAQIGLPPLPAYIKMTVVFVDAASRHYTYRCTFARRYGQEKILLEGMQPLPGSQKKPADTSGAHPTVKEVLNENPLSSDLQDKFNQWGAKSQNQSAKISPVQPSIGQEGQGEMP